MGFEKLKKKKKEKKGAMTRNPFRKYANWKQLRTTFFERGATWSFKMHC